MALQGGLFHDDDFSFFDADALRRAAAWEIAVSPLIGRAAHGDRTAIVALHRGFWPFVSAFERAIDEHVLPRRPLQERFGHAQFAETFVGLAREVKHMREEEGSHAALWEDDADAFGIGELDGPIVGGVQALIDQAYASDHTRFFCALAGTEFIAEELSRRLVQSAAFTSASALGRWKWGEVHLAAHEGHSHLEIDLDLARAYSPDASSEALSALVLETIHLFGRAAAQVEHALAEPRRAPARRRPTASSGRG